MEVPEIAVSNLFVSHTNCEQKLSKKIQNVPVMLITDFHWVIPLIVTIREINALQCQKPKNFHHNILGENNQVTEYDVN